MSFSEIDSELNDPVLCDVLKKSATDINHEIKKQSSNFPDAKSYAKYYANEFKCAVGQHILVSEDYKKFIDEFTFSQKLILRAISKNAFNILSVIDDMKYFTEFMEALVIELSETKFS